MRTLLCTIILLLFLAPEKGSALDSPTGFLLPPDSIPPPPPSGNVPLTGPDEACVGDTSTYFTEVPVACSCQWSINGVIQPVTGPEMQVTWPETGMHIVTLSFVCSGGQTSDPQAIPVTVSSVPVVDLGPDTAILQGESLTLDAGNPGSGYLWSTGATTQTIVVSQAGTYSVTVSNDCGDDWDDIQVSVITGIKDHGSEFEGKIFFDGERVRIYPVKENISCMKISDILGRTLYEGRFIGSFHPENKGLLVIRLITPHGTCIIKLMVG